VPKQVLRQGGANPNERPSGESAAGLWPDRNIRVAIQTHCGASPPVHPVQCRADNDQRHSAIDDGVAHQVNLTFIGQWAEQAQRFSPEDARETGGGKSEGVSRRSLHRRY